MIGNGKRLVYFLVEGNKIEGIFANIQDCKNFYNEGKSCSGGEVLIWQSRNRERRFCLMQLM